MTAQLIDLAAVRSARGLESIQDVRDRRASAVREHLAAGRARLVAEARALPRPFRTVALAIVEWVTTYDRHCGGRGRLDKFDECRRYDIATGSIDGEMVAEVWTYEDRCRRSLLALERAIAELRKAEREPGRRRVAARRRMLTAAKGNLLRLLFRFGRRRIDFDELAWRTDWDGRCTYTRRRQAWRPGRREARAGR